MKLIDIDKIDFSSFRQNVTMRDVEECRRRQGAKIPIIAWCVIVAAVVIVLIVATVISMIISMILAIDVTFKIGPFMLLIILGVYAYLILWPDIKRHVSLNRFAIRNGLAYDPKGKDSIAGNGIIFNVGDLHKQRSVMTKSDGQHRKLFEIGRYEYSVGFGYDGSMTYYWLYTCIDMKRQMPHIVLDAKDNELNLIMKLAGINKLPLSFSSQQKIDLEGDFSKYFTLYAPKGYDADVRYIFTPDIMMSLIDESHHFDVELIDDKLYFYQRMLSDEYGEEQLKGLLRVVGIVGQKIYDRTKLYYDERSGQSRGADIVAKPGRRLKTV